MEADILFGDLQSIDEGEAMGILNFFLLFSGVLICGICIGIIIGKRLTREV